MSDREPGAGQAPDVAPRALVFLCWRPPANNVRSATYRTLAGARRLATRLQRHGTVGLSSFYADPGELGRSVLCVDAVKPG